MGPRLLMFAGAPVAASLKWDENGLLSDFIEPIARFANIEREVILITPDATRTALQPPVWRSLPLEKRSLETGFTQSFNEKQAYTKAPQAQGWLENSRGASFFTTSQVESFIEEGSQQQTTTDSFESMKSVEGVLSQFYEESYARHETIPSSQIVPASDVGTSFMSSEFSDSFDSLAHPSAEMRDIPVAGHLGNLKDIPNANYLNSIQPQTMTVNLIIGIISIPEPRLIKTRRGANVELIEVLVGDETKSGFGINFWLASNPDPNVNAIKSTLKDLRPQDIILVKNVALSSFRNKVYGQSLRKDMTKVHLLYRYRIDKTDARGCYSAADLSPGEKGLPQIEKTKRVKEWVSKFVGLGPTAGVTNYRKRNSAEVAREVLPEDTQ